MLSLFRHRLSHSYRRVHVCNVTIKSMGPRSEGVVQCHQWQERCPSRDEAPGTDPDFLHCGDETLFEAADINDDVLPDRNISYSQLVNEHFFTEEFLDSVCEGCNDHANRKNDDEYFELFGTDGLQGPRGRMRIRCYLAIEVQMELANKTESNFWRQNIQNGTLHISRCFSKGTYRAIRRNLCFNPNSQFTHNSRDPNYDPYKDFEDGLIILEKNAQRCIDMMFHFSCLDEGRGLNTSSSNPNSSFQQVKPERKAVDLNAMSVAVGNHVCYCLAIIPFNKGRMVDENVRFSDADGDTDNLVIRLCKRANIPDFCVMHQDSRFNSVHLHETIGPGCDWGFIGPVLPNINHLPRGKYKRNDVRGLFDSKKWAKRVKNMNHGLSMSSF